LRSLGVHPSEIPPDEAAASALLRTVTTDRRLLLVLDNAAVKDQVAPLLPACPNCAVLVTSRYPQPSLDVDQRLRVAVFDEADGLALLLGLKDSLDPNSDAVREILALTGGLPLAIRVAGGRLACRRDLPAAEYAARLADRSRRLDELQLDDLAVRASVRTSYDALQSSRDQMQCRGARAFRMLGLLNTTDFAPGVVAALLDERDTDIVRVSLDRLVDAQLLEPTAMGRYRLHDLVRLVAAECALEEESRLERDTAIERAVAFYAAGVRRADALLHISSTLLLHEPPAPHHVAEPAFDGQDQARAWVDDELLNLVSVMEQLLTIPHSRGPLALRLGHTLWNMLDARCAWQAAHSVSRMMVESFGSHADQQVAAYGLLLHGRSEACLGNYATAVTHFEQALRLFTSVDDQSAAALVHNGLGVAMSRQGRMRAALSQYEAALLIARRLELTGLVATLLLNMSVGYTYLGELSRAIAVAEEAVGMRPPTDLVTRAGAMINLSGVYCIQGNQAEAVRCADEAIRLCGEMRDPRRKCEALIGRSESNLRSGRFTDAYTDAAEALSLAGESGYRFVAAAAMHQQARALDAMDRTHEAPQVAPGAAETDALLRNSSADALIMLLLGIQDVQIGRRQPLDVDNTVMVPPLGGAAAEAAADGALDQAGDPAGRIRPG
jgi:tetratricopeptide (TPR) repeat protein